MDNQSISNQSSSNFTDWLSQYRADLSVKASAIEASMSAPDIPLMYAICGVGLLGNSLIILASIISTVKFHVVFRWTMIVTSIADSVHLLFKLLRMFARLYWNAILTYQILSGIMYVCSLFSDLLALTLTVDRFVGMVFPVFYKNLHRGPKRFVWLLAISICLLISITRLHYTFAGYYFADFPFVSSQWFESLTYFSDTVVPFLLLVITVVLVFTMVIVLRKRFNEQKKNRSMEKLINERIKDMRKTTSLMMSLLFVCFLNQFGYVFYQITYMLNQRCVAFSFINESEIYNCFVVRVSYALGGRVSLHCENLSKAANFYLYIIFNQTFRRSFASAIVRCRPTVANSSSAGG